MNNSWYDNSGHNIIYNETDCWCEFCGKNCKFICKNYNIGLLPKTGFKLYHS